MLAAGLRVVSGTHAGEVIQLNSRKFLIGREQDCHLRPNSEMVSRHHCAFSLDEFSVRLRDLGSTNGTMVNGQRIRSEVVLESGDRVVIGNLDFVVEISQEQRAAEDSVTRASTEVVAVQETQATDPVVPQQQPPQVPAGGDTVVLPVQGMMPPGQPFPGMMPQMGYPPGYGMQSPMVPGFGQVYPGMMYPQIGAGMPGQQPAMMPGQPQSAETQAEPKPPTVDVALPDPSETGVKEQPTGQSKGSTGSDKSDGAKPTGAAEDIIRKMMGRGRPPGKG